MSWGRTIMLLTGLVTLTGLGSGVAHGQAAVQVFAQPNNMIQLNENQIVAWVFQNQSNRDRAFELAREKVKTEVMFIDQVCELTDAQKTRLELGGMGDVIRFQNELTVYQKTLTYGMVTQQKWQEIWQEIQPFRTRFNQGLHGDDSMLAKLLVTTLDDQQRQAYQKAQQARKQRQYISLTKGFVVMLERTLPLTSAQHEQFVELLAAQPLPKTLNTQSQYLTYLMMYQVSLIDEDTLQPIFEDNEWEVINELRTRGRSMKRTLQNEGLVAK